MRKLQIPLRVHCWGGLGSQLFGVILYLELRAKFPSRRITLCLHESGVTRRNSEVGGIFKNIEVEEIKDFSQVEAVAPEKESNHSAAFKNIFKSLLVKLKVLLTLDDSTNLNSVRFWTLSIRGHYSYRRISSESINLLLSNLTPGGLERLNAKEFEEVQLGVHYRLGDLLELSTKQPMQVERLSKAVESRLELNSDKTITVFSDSPSKALSLLRKKMPNATIVNKNLPTWETIGVLLNSESFVGTFSKISLWVVVLRYFSSDLRPSYMPIESSENLKQLLGDSLEVSKLSFYN